MVLLTAVLGMGACGGSTRDAKTPATDTSPAMGPAPDNNSANNPFGQVVRCGPAGSGAARKIVLISGAIAGVTLVGELLAVADAMGVPRDAALDGLAAGPLAGAVARVRSTGSNYAVWLAAKDVGLATDAADLPQLAAARDWLRATAAEGAAGEDLRYVIDHIH